MDPMIVPLMAQEAAGGAAAQSPFSHFLIVMAVMFAIMYFVWIRPQEKEAKKREGMLNALKKGDEVVTSGGLHGRVHAVKEISVQIKLADKLPPITVSRANIAKKVTEEASDE